jgi:phosphatidate cytidylyltransferase
MSRLAARIATGLTLAALVLALLWLDTRFPPGWFALAVATVLAFASAWELDRMGSFRGRGLGPMLYAAALASAVLVGVWLGFLDRADVRWGLVLLYVSAAASSHPGAVGLLVRIVNRNCLPAPREAVPLAVWSLPPLFSIALVEREFGTRGLFALVFLAKIGDNAAYFVGRAIGKRHPFPNVSPGKTVAGCVASLVAGIVSGAIVLPLTLGQRTPAHACLGAFFGGLLNLAAQAGDLSESWVKRRAGVKDSSPLLGPSGGVLDALDSLLFAAPLALCAWSWAYPAAAR